MNETYGRGLYVFTGLSSASNSPTSDATASTWAKKPLPGQRAYETDTLNVYEFDSLTWLKIRGPDSAGNPAVNVVAELTNLANTLGLYTPARDVLLDWFHGTDLDPRRLVAETADGVWVDMRKMNPAMRNIVILAGSGTSLDYDYTVHFSRSGIDADQYLVASDTAVSTQETQVLLPASLGYDLFVKLTITPAAGQTAEQLDFQSYLVGRGG